MSSSQHYLPFLDSTPFDAERIDSILNNHFHQNERTKPIALSLFSGAGGMDLGISQVGFDIIACIEIDPHCCETLRAWVGHERRNTRINEISSPLTQCFSFNTTVRRNFLSSNRRSLFDPKRIYASSWLPRQLYPERSHTWTLWQSPLPGPTSPNCQLGTPTRC